MARAQKKQEANSSQGTPSIRKIRSAEFVNIYANQAEMGFSAHDMRFSFSELVEQPDNSLVVEERARVVMSLSHAKQFLMVLANNIKAFEDQIGEIQVIDPAKFQAALKAE